MIGLWIMTGVLLDNIGQKKAHFRDFDPISGLLTCCMYTWTCVCLSNCDALG